MSFLFLSFFCFPLERWGSNIKGHFYIVNLFTDSPFAFILEKYVLCQGVAIWPSVSDCPLPTSAEHLLAFQRSPHFLVHIHSWSIFFFKMVPALCCSSLHDEGNNFIIYLLDTITNTRDLWTTISITTWFISCSREAKHTLELSEPLPRCVFYLSETWANLDKAARCGSIWRSSVNLKKKKPYLSACFSLIHLVRGK